MAKSKDTKAVAPSGKQPRGRPRKLHSIEEQKSSVAPGVDHGGGGDGDRGVGKVKGMSKEEDLLKDILLGNSSDNQESGQVYTCVAAAVSIRLLSHAVGGVCELRRHLKRVCDVRVSEATTDVCILHGSWLNIAKAKLCISQCLQRQGAGNMERLEGQGTNNTPGTNIKEELGTDTSPDLQIIERQDKVNTPDTEIIEGQGKVNSPASQFMEGQAAGDTCGTRHKRPACSPAEDAPSVKRHAGNVLRQLTDNNCVTEEITPPIEDVTVKRSTRKRRPTFSSSEWATPHGSPRRGSKEGEKINKSKCRTALSSQSIRGSRSRKQSEDPLLRDPAQQNGCVSDVETAGDGHLDLKQEPDVPSERYTMKEETDPHEGVIKHDTETSKDAAHTGILPNSISSEMIETVASREGSLAGGNTETVGVNVSPEATPAGDRTNKSEADTPISHSDDSERPVSNGQKCEVFSTVCEICGFKSATAQGLVNHKGNYHSVVMYECDICFRRFGYKNVRDRHRGSHIHDDGTLKESALIVHQMALKKQCRIENLSPELLCGAAGAVCVNAGVEENGSMKLVEHLLDWEREEGLVGKPPKNADNKTEDHCLGSEVKEQLQEVDIPRDGAGGKELKTDALEENVELSSVCGSEQTGNQPRLYECELCGARLTQAYYLKKHYEAVHYSGRQRKKTDSVRNQLGRRNDTAYACPHCTFVCYRIQNFTRHVDSHRQPALHHCQLCNYSNKLRGEVARHMRNAHGEKKFKCHLCGCVFRTQILLNCHVKQKHEKSRRTVCEICGKVLMTRKSYYKHKELYHGDEAVVGKVMCQTCGRVLNSQKLYDAHWRKCHGEDANNEEEREIGQALQILSNGHFQCRHCLYKNAVAREVRRHIIRVHAEKKFKCDHCSAAFPRQSFLNKHVRIQHQGAEKAQCGQCKKVFKNYVNLKAHMNRIHLEDKPYQCSVCLRAFFDKRTLVMHMDLHRPEDERDWKFECKPCGRHFRFKCNYEYHMQDHTGRRPHVCATCNKAFKTKSMMETHMTVHSDERPYSCSQCGKRFKLQKYLDVHVLTHASEKVCCAACGKIFGQPDDLKKHICRAIPVAATGIEGDSTGLGLVGSAGELRQINMEELSVLGDGTTVTTILVEQHEGDDSGANIGDCLEVTDSDTHMVIEQQALVCETAEGSQLFPLADTAGDESRLDVTAVAMYMCGLCRKLYATQEEINDHMQEHIDVDVECEGDKLLAQLEASSDDTGEVPAVTVEEVGLDTTGTVAYM